ncbi:MAG TPA: histidinol-phosphate transaminase [Acidimicrobiia bacterium]|jgi:histidinol-phosphate aminotransferase|nr:histidinol-phosphate transaminase [Acidimicrobiia bacterium]
MTAPRYKWQPTTSEIARRAGIAPSDVIRFDHNTSPFPTDWASELAAEVSRSLNEYPGASYLPIREAAGDFVGLEPERVAVGAGVDELLLLVGRAFLGPGRRSLAIAPTYPLYRIASLQVGATLTEVPAGPDLAFPTDAFVRAARDADVTWLCVPDNPSGARLPEATIEAVIAATDGIVVLDAAYAEFAGDEWAAWAERYHNLLVLHTMSKGFGLGGIRVGYGLGHPDLVDALDGVRPPGSIASISVEIAIAALREPERMRKQVASIITERSALADRLRGLGFAPLPSRTNFLLCHAGGDARAVGEALMGEGLVVRMYPTDGPLGAYLRFTVRSTSENDRLIAALERILP